MTRARFIQVCRTLARHSCAVGAPRAAERFEGAIREFYPGPRDWQLFEAGRLLRAEKNRQRRAGRLLRAVHWLRSQVRLKQAGNPEGA